MRERLTELGIDVEDRAGRATALPENARAVSVVVREARERGVVVAPHWSPGSRAPTESPEGATDTVGSLASSGRDRAAELEGGVILLSRERMRGVEDVQTADLMATVGAGITADDLSSVLAEHGLFWPPAQLTGRDEMLGDALDRAPGNHTELGNTIRRYTLMLEVILPDASHMRAGAKTVKSVAGYDLKQLFIGSWQTLGVATGVTLRLEALANRDSVLARLESDFAPLRAMLVEDEAGTHAAQGVVEAAWSEFLLRLKRELDPTGVFPSVETVGQG